MPSWAEADTKENDASRLSGSESVHLSGLVLAEIFTPSNISALKRAYENLPVSKDKRDELLSHLGKSRSAAGLGGSVDLVFSGAEASRRPKL
jgi:hypothetical protein